MALTQSRRSPFLPFTRLCPQAFERFPSLNGDTQTEPPEGDGHGSTTSRNTQRKTISRTLHGTLRPPGSHSLLVQRGVLTTTVSLPLRGWLSRTHVDRDGSAFGRPWEGGGSNRRLIRRRTDTAPRGYPCPGLVDLIWTQKGSDGTTRPTRDSAKRWTSGPYALSSNRPTSSLLAVPEARRGPCLSRPRQTIPSFTFSVACNKIV